MRSPDNRTCLSSRGFTLMEILITIVIIAVLASIISVGAARMRERARKVVDIAKLRELGNCLFARGMSKNGSMYHPEETGYSHYRQWKDPLSLCQILEREDYLAADDTWVGPTANERQLKYKNSYAWASNDFVTQMTTTEKPMTKMVLWNAYPYTLPSVQNVPESPTTKGPRPANSQYHFRPWNGRTKYHAFFLDGHVELR